MYNLVCRYIMNLPTIMTETWFYLDNYIHGNEAKCGKCNVIRINSWLMHIQKYIMTLTIKVKVRIYGTFL